MHIAPALCQLKPFFQLILFFSKSLLRHPLARSNLEEMVGETQFERYIPEPHPATLAAPEDIKRHILCTGQVYFALLQAREERGITDIAISRIEQLSPFPYDMVRSPFSPFYFLQDG